MGQFSCFSAFSTRRRYDAATTLRTQTTSISICFNDDQKEYGPVHGNAEGIEWIKSMTEGNDWIKSMTEGIYWIKFMTEGID